MDDKINILKNFDNAKLIDVVKNCKQYGYDETLRSAAINILKDRGISEDELTMSGNASNAQYEQAAGCYHSFNRNSKIAFILYIVSLLMTVLIATLKICLINVGEVVPLLSSLSIIGYLVYLSKSFSDHNSFYTAIGKKLAPADQAIFFILGAFYIIMYFFYKSQMSEEMQTMQ